MTESTIAPATRTDAEHRFTASDGVDLFFRSWKPDGDNNHSPRKAVILFHRGHEHSARWQDVVDRMNLPDCWFFAWDARGHGHSPGERGYADSMGRFVQDADEWVQHISREFQIAVADMAVLAQSVGAVIAATWVHDYAPPIPALVLGTPAFRVKLYVPLAITGLRLLNKMKKPAFIKSYVKPSLLTHDKEQAKLYAEDKLISPQIAVNILLGLYDTSTRIIEDAGAIHTPTLLLMSGSDWVVKKAPQQRFYQRLSSTIKKRISYPGFFHSTFWEKDRDKPIAAARDFIAERFKQAPLTPGLLDADQAGFTKSVCDDLEQPLSPLNPKRWWFAAQAIGMKTLGRMSKGIQEGWRTGFDSGESLDHVYRNKAEGITPIGRMMDRAYLNSPGWIGIRQRKVHMEQMLETAIAEQSSSGKSIHILDIAAGPGRYVLETILRHGDKQISATLGDRDEGGLAAGRKLAEELGVTTATYQTNDAFDGDAIAAIEPLPTIGIVSGLYELFPNNELIRKSLDGMRRAIAPGGTLLYTNQPWHPQQEMIARVLPNRDGDPWIMRCRTQAEMDQLVAAAGFRKRKMLIDDAGIFSVSMAERVD